MCPPLSCEIGATRSAHRNSSVFILRGPGKSDPTGIAFPYISLAFFLCGSAHKLLVFESVAKKISGVGLKEVRPINRLDAAHALRFECKRVLATSSSL